MSSGYGGDEADADAEAGAIEVDRTSRRPNGEPAVVLVQEAWWEDRTRRPDALRDRRPTSDQRGYHNRGGRPGRRW